MSFLSCTSLIWIYITFFPSHEVIEGVVSYPVEEFDSYLKPVWGWRFKLLTQFAQLC